MTTGAATARTIATATKKAFDDAIVLEKKSKALEMLSFFGLNFLCWVENGWNGWLE